MKLLNLKVRFGTAKMVRVTGAKYLAWEDAFEVDFEDGLTFLEPHATIREANKISAEAKPVRVELDEEPCIGFLSTTTTARAPKFDGHLCGSCHQKIQRNKLADLCAKA